jgi:plasmid stabilization system protein ParE
MPYRVELTAQAKRDLAHIYRSIDAANSETARRWFDGFHAALRSLDEMPQRWPFIPEGRSLRHLLYGDKPYVYRAIFTVDEAGGKVVINTIRHGARAPYRR